MNGQIGYIIRAFMGLAYIAAGVTVLQKGQIVFPTVLENNTARYALGGLLVAYGIFRFARNKNESAQ
jgi:hypothetical protein